jgi:hypothetical protein
MNNIFVVPVALLYGEASSHVIVKIEEKRLISKMSEL